MVDPFIESARRMVSPVAGTLDDVRAWLADRAERFRPEVEEIPLDAMRGWVSTEDTGDLAHSSGGFFRIRGLQVDGVQRPWNQPIIYQPEIGILGILAREIDGVLCLLMQAKMEPGNVNTVQLSPTVQATRSNYSRVHGGLPTRFLDYFAEPGNGEVLVDVLQSEQCSSFYQKRNRNMIIRVDGDVSHGDEHRWVTLGQVRALLHEDNAVNMNARSVLSNLPLDKERCAKEATEQEAGAYAQAVLASLADEGGTIGVRNWFNRVKGISSICASLVPLRGLTGWQRSDTEFRHDMGCYFRVLAVNVGSSDREVSGWDQPLIQPAGRGVIAFLTRRREGVLEALVQANVEAGTRDVAELAPTVQAVPASWASVPRDQWPPYLAAVLAAPAARFRYDTLLSEEGGRFYRAEHRYAVLEADDEQATAPPPPTYRWCTLGQLTDLVQHSGYLNVEARSLLSCLHTLW